MLSLDAHNIVDYFVAVTLVVFTIVVTHIPGARTLFALCAVALVVYNLLSDMPLSARKVIPVHVHWALDLVVAFLLIAGPWLFGYRGDMNLAETSAHVGAGVTLLLLIGLTDRQSALTWPTEQKDELRETDDRPAELAGRR